MRTRLLALSLAALAAAPALAQQGPPRDVPAPNSVPKPTPLGEAASRTLANSFDTAETWSLQAMALWSLGTDWHPVASEALAKALASDDERLAVQALEQLRRTDDRVLASVCTATVVDALVGKHVASKNELQRSRAIEVLERVLPEVDGSKPATIARWWTQRRPEYAPTAWTPAEPAAKEGGTVSSALMEKAMDLRDAGLQVAFVVDSTGSMQRAIDAVRDAIGEIAIVLGGIAPKLEIGLVHYKDFGDMGDAAAVLLPLSKNMKLVREKLGKLLASGGGDVPERVEKGLACALGKEMGWDKDKNRMLVVVGDAPPHPDARAELVALAKDAFERPFEDAKRPTTGKKEKLRPFITSAICTDPQARPSFTEMAEAGGGTVVSLQLGAAPAPGRGKRAPAAGGSGAAPEAIAKHVLRLSFGQQFAAQIDLFVDTFFEYRRAGLY